MSVEFTASVFRNGRSRAIRIPAGIDLPGDKITIRQDDDGIITLQSSDQRTRAFVAMLRSWTSDGVPFPEIHDPPAEPIDFGWDDDQQHIA